jgi:hypothetical protein
MEVASGASSLEVQDFNGDGNREILIGSWSSVYLVQKSASDYVQTWAYPFSTALGFGIAAVASGDVDGDGHREIFFSSGPVVVELDGVTRREIARYGVAVPNPGGGFNGPFCTNVKVADVDNDGALELVCLGADAQYGYPATARIYVLDARTLQLKWQSDDLALGTSMAVGNVDADATLEIVTSAGYVFDGATGANKWAYGPGFGTLVDVGDVNGDGVGKIVATTSTGLTVYDAVNKTALWSIAANVGTFSSMRVANLDAISPSELLVADDVNVSVYRYDSGTQAPVLLTQTNILGYQTAAITAGDVDGDGKQEIVWAPTFSLANNSPNLAIASWTPTATLLWSGPLPISLDGPFVCAQLAKVSPTQSTLIFATPRTRQGYSGMRVIGLDPVTGSLSASQEIDANWPGNKSCDVADVTGSGTDSVLLGTAMYSSTSSYFTAYDFLSSTKQWSSPSVTGLPMAVTHLDVNGDGIADLIGVTYDGHLFAWDVHNQVLIWSTSGIGYAVDVATDDLNGDGQKEIVVLSASQVAVFTFNGSTVTQTASYSITSGADLLVADTDGDGKAEIYVLKSANGATTVYRFNGALAPLSNFSFGGASVASPDHLYLEDSAFARKNLLITVSQEGATVGVIPQIEAVDAVSGAVVWKSPPLRGDVQLDSLNFYDLDGNGKREIVFGTNFGMYVTQ